MALMTLWNTYMACIDSAQTRGCFPKLYDKKYFDYKEKFLEQNIVTIINEQVFFWKNNLQDNVNLKEKIESHCVSSIIKGEDFPTYFEDKNGDIYLSDIFPFILGTDRIKKIMTIKKEEK